jgi:uncharacterized protein (TIGR00299 family) protein
VYCLEGRGILVPRTYLSQFWIDSTAHEDEALKIAYLDCFSGIAGNMLLGACVDAGAPLDGLRSLVASLKVAGLSVTNHRVQRGRIMGTHVLIEVDEDPPHRRLADVVTLVQQADASESVKQGSEEVFRLLAEAEARVHGKESPEQAVFHEVGALDAVADVLGSLWCIEALGIERIVASPVQVGTGTVKCRHGLMPLPAPATAYLLKGAPVYSRGVEAELVTPTGAALLRHLADEFGPLPTMKVERIGYGCGDRDLAEHPNVLRLMLGESTTNLVQDEVAVVETNIDDMNPEVFDHLFARCFKAGAVDVYVTSIQMKKNRPGWKLAVIAPVEQEDGIARLLLAETSTFGVRSTVWRRRMLDREIRTVETEYGPVRVKVGRAEGILKAAPEYEDCRQQAETAKVPLLRVYQAALNALPREET